MATPIPAYSSIVTSLPPSPKAMDCSRVRPRWASVWARPLGLPPPAGRISQKSSSQRTARQPGQRRRNSASFSGGRNALSW